MKRLAALISGPALAAVILLGTSRAYAQQPHIARPKADKAAEEQPLSLGEVTATPEMWFYEQSWRRYNDPHMAVRAKAEFYANQRARRIASLKWFGFSNARPTANPTPLMGTYAPTWTGNSFEPFHWRGVGYTGVYLNARRLDAESVYGLW